MEPTPLCASSRKPTTGPTEQRGCGPGSCELRCRGWGRSTGKPKREPLPWPQAQGTGNKLDR